MKDLSEEVCSCLALYHNICPELDWTQLNVVNRYLLWIYYVQVLQYIIEETNYFHSSNGEKNTSLMRRSFVSTEIFSDDYSRGEGNHPVV